MLIPKDNKIRRFPLKNFEPEFDRKLYKTMTKDMNKNGGAHQPGPRWQMSSLFKEDKQKQKSPSFKDMVEPWIGVKAAQPVTEEVFAVYCDYFRDRDKLELFGSYFPNWTYRDDTGLNAADLGSILDLNFLHEYIEVAESKKAMILEIGGGYGRLAEACFNVFDDQFIYVMVDAVPASLFYAYTYLTQLYPEKKIGFYYNGDKFDLNLYDCYLVPIWHFEKLYTSKFDCCINIASFQEMEDQQVTFYLDLFNRVCATEGIIYLSNSRDFIYKREFNYPDNWQLLVKENTPRSWTPYYPVEILKKTEQDCTDQNAQKQLEYLPALIKAYQEHVSLLEGRLAVYRKANVNLKKNIERLEKEY
jgi:putative sugar O-methyltransferase